MNLKSMMDKKVIFIIGPTAIGKTSLSIEIAKELSTEIISCDSRQFYKELQIGTAPPTKKELNKIQHHFIHHLSIKDNYNAGKFEIDAIKLITNLHKKLDTIIIVGGSGLYVDAICKGFDNLPEIPLETRAILNSKYKEKGLSWLQQKIKKIDSEFYNSCDKNNSQRLLRALEIYNETGKKISTFKLNKKKKRKFKIIKIGLNSDREVLYKKINKRVENMIENGLIEEVNSLTNYQNYNALQTVGYKEIFAFINNKCTLEEAIENIKRNTRRFAKRQLTWFKKDQQIKWFEPNQRKEIKKFISGS
tara:strand:- start:3860 stop:4774 length:915 start_codon:yes stop_codon:yes gene_type:complete